MNEKSKAWLGRTGVDKWFRKDNLIVLVLSGILLFIIALPTNDDATQKAKNGESKDFESGDVAPDGSAGGNTNGLWDESAQKSSTWDVGEDYAVYLEERLETLLGGVSDVGQVAVMITLESSEELIVEKDEPIVRSNVNETDAAGGERISAQLETNETTVYSTEGSDSEPYVIMKMLPRVEGIVVVAEGAGYGSVNKNITEMIQALFDVEAHKIKVVKMTQSN